MISFPIAAKAVVNRHLQYLRSRFELRRFLNIKRNADMLEAMKHTISNPAALPAIIRGIATDKFPDAATRMRPEHHPVKPRYLLTETLLGMPPTERAAVSVHS